MGATGGRTRQQRPQPDFGFLGSTASPRPPTAGRSGRFRPGPGALRPKALAAPVQPPQPAGMHTNALPRERLYFVDWLRIGTFALLVLR
jgi:hypothetical protein